MPTITVVLADDDEQVREALRLTLVADGRFTVVGTAGTGESVRDAVRETHPDLVLMDVHMPAGGPELCRAVSGFRDGGDPPVVVAVSADHHVTTVRSMLRAGATGYLGNGLLGEGLGDLLAACARGRVVLAVPHARRVFQGWGEDPDS